MTTDASVKEQWLQFLQERGAAARSAGDVDAFRGDSGLRQAQSGCFVCDLSSCGLLAFNGPDAEAFLHGQLSSDVKALDSDHAQLATYNTPKGRILATLVLWRAGSGFTVQLPASIAGSVLRRLSMFILRSNVQASDDSERYGDARRDWVMQEMEYPGPQAACARGLPRTP